MRKLLLAFVLSGAFVPAIQAQARAAPAAPATSAEGIAPLAWMVGGTWVGEEPGAGGATLKVLMTARWAETRNAILFDVAFESAGKRTAQYNGMFLWHPGRKNLTLWQINRKGEVAEGEVFPSAEAIDQTVSVDHLDGTRHFLKVRYRLLDRDTFHFKGFFRLREDAPWQDAVEVTYRRQP